MSLSEAGWKGPPTFVPLAIGTTLITLNLHKRLQLLLVLRCVLRRAGGAPRHEAVCDIQQCDWYVWFVVDV